MWLFRCGALVRLWHEGATALHRRSSPLTEVLRKRVCVVLDRRP